MSDDDTNIDSYEGTIDDQLLDEPEIVTEIEPTSEPIDSEGVKGLKAAVARVEQNMAVRGTLRVHHQVRDIDMPCDGFHALSLLQHFAGKSQNPGLQFISPFRSNAENGWTVLDYDAVVAITWIPDVEITKDTRVAFDPA